MDKNKTYDEVIEPCINELEMLLGSSFAYTSNFSYSGGYRHCMDIDDAKSLEELHYATKYAEETIEWDIEKLKTAIGIYENKIRPVLRESAMIATAKINENNEVDGFMIH